MYKLYNASMGEYCDNGRIESRLKGMLLTPEREDD